ncbi:MAG: Flp pilus assembly complex ATPase component TadA [Phycisphaerae bacterium]|nr:Flp pilus assembly complex ATPase component TadA [Phycisphaerae bacterium]
MLGRTVFAMATFKLVCSNAKIGSFELGTGSVAIGRHPDNDIPLKDDDVASRFHCVIEPGANGQYILKDLGSRNGTRVNGEPVSTAPINPGDVIVVGKHTFSLKAEEPKPVKPVKAAAPTAEASAGPDDESPWAVELRNILDALPPKQSQLEFIHIIDAGGNRSEALRGEGQGSTAVRLLLLTGSKARATDIHCEPKGETYSVRMRVDGQMVHIVELPKVVGDLALGLIRNACQMQQAPRDATLDGHFATRFPDRKVDYRASFTPTVHGHKLVARILDERIAPQSLSDIHMPIYMLERIRKACQNDAGMILACGPTGSGKTTTLYNALREIDRQRRNVVTIEDPVEYTIDNVTQIPVGHNNTFGDILRSVLRQDPDVILVGEIRDGETARTAAQAAMTGHVVFSTVHAKDTIGAVFRLLDLGIEPYLVANSMDVIIAQRLIRVLCEYCKRPVKVTPGQSTRIGRFLEGKAEVFAATGCSRCLRTGFNGRRAVFEMLDFNDELRDCVLNQPTIAQMKKIIEQGVFTTLQQSGWLMAARGITTLDEVERVTGV